MSGIVIRNATIIDATGADPQPGSTIVVGADGAITAVGPDASTEIPQGVEVVDGTGKYVIPGLMDANVHLVAARTPDTLLDFEENYHELAIEAAELTLKYGTTTVFDTWGPAAPLVQARDAINAGTAKGSRIYCAGNIIGLGGPLSSDFLAPGVFLERDRVARINEIWERGTGPELSTFTAEQVGERIDQYIEETGVDFIKWAITDHNSAPGDFYLFLDRANRAIVDSARKAGLTVQAHTSTVESLRTEVELGADVLQHGDITMGQAIPEYLIDEIVERGQATAALVLSEARLHWTQTAAVSAGVMREGYYWGDVNQRAMIAKGARLMLTTDGFAYGPRIWNHPGFRAGTLSPDTPDISVQLGFGHFNWIKGAFEKGMQPMEVLRSATSHIADAYQVSHLVGTLEVGKQGDMLVLDADPLSGHEAYREIRHVIKGGEIVDRDGLAQNMQVGADWVKEFGFTAS